MSYNGIFSLVPRKFKHGCSYCGRLDPPATDSRCIGCGAVRPLSLGRYIEVTTIGSIGEEWIKVR